MGLWDFRLCVCLRCYGFLCFVNRSVSGSLHGFAGVLRFVVRGIDQTGFSGLRH